MKKSSLIAPFVATVLVAICVMLPARVRAQMYYSSGTYYPSSSTYYPTNTGYSNYNYYQQYPTYSYPNYNSYPYNNNNYYYNQYPYYNYNYTNPLYVSCYPNRTSVTFGTPVTWTAYASGGNGYYTYSWTGENMYNTNSNSVNVYYNSYGSKTGTVTVTSGNQSMSRYCGSVYVNYPYPQTYQTYPSYPYYNSYQYNPYNW